MRAALEAARNGANVAVISKVHPVRSLSGAAQGGINAAIGEGDSWEVHALDTIKGSDYLADQDAVEVMTSEAPSDIIELEHMGVIFYRAPDGKLGTRAFGGASKARTYFVGDITGQALLYTLYDQLLKAGVKVYEEWFATSLYVVDGACRGCVALEMMKGDLHLLRAKATIIASGGMGRVYEPSTNALICTGDGISLAYRAGERFMERYAPKMKELASRDVVSRAEWHEINEGRGVDGCVLLDLRHLGPDVVLRKLPQIHEMALDFLSIDMLTDPVPVR